jgi:hypothetical protein
VALLGRTFVLFALVLFLAPAVGMPNVARAQSPGSTDELEKRLDDHIRANIQTAEKAVAAGDCRKFNEEMGAARDRLDDLWRLLGPGVGEERGLGASILEGMLAPLVEEGCPKGAGFKPKTKIGLQIKNEFDALRTQMLTAQKTTVLRAMRGSAT